MSGKNLVLVGQYGPDPYILDLFWHFGVFLHHFIGQKFVGQNFCHQAKISSILSQEYFCMTNFCPKILLDVIHAFQCLRQKSTKMQQKLSYNGHLLKYQRNNFLSDIYQKIYQQFRNLCKQIDQILDNFVKSFFEFAHVSGFECMRINFSSIWLLMLIIAYAADNYSLFTNC